MIVNLINIKKVYHSTKNKLMRSVTRCRVCTQPVLPGHHICPHCLTRLSPVDGPLCRCCLPCAAADHGNLCGRCLTHPPSFHSCHCAWHYRFPLDRLINHYKHHGDLSIEPLLGEIWVAGLNVTPPAAATLVPIPAHWQRLAKRGFNQSARLARHLSRRLGLPLTNALSQPRPAPYLQGMSATQRRHYSRDRFRVNANVQQQHLILIDDVMTTGATANEAANTLLAAGATRVDLWTLCRVPPPGKQTFTAV